MKPRLYMETSVISYLTARPPRDLVMSARQLNTHKWWTEKRRNFQIFISRFVWDEASSGDLERVKLRQKFLKPLPMLQLNSDVARLARALLFAGAMPPKAEEDAIHVAVAAV